MKQPMQIAQRIKEIKIMILIKKIKISLVLLVLGMLILVLILWPALPRQQVVFFDLKGATQLFMRQVVKAKLSSSEQKTLSKRFSLTLKTVLNQYSRSHHVVILVKGAVINGPDITKTIEHQVAKAMEARHG